MDRWVDRSVFVAGGWTSATLASAALLVGAHAQGPAWPLVLLASLLNLTFGLHCGRRLR